MKMMKNESKREQRFTRGTTITLSVMRIAETYWEAHLLIYLKKFDILFLLNHVLFAGILNEQEQDEFC